METPDLGAMASARSTGSRGTSTHRSSTVAGVGGGVSAGSAAVVQSLCFGDIVQLLCCEDVGSSGVAGVMASDGFADGQCDIRKVLDAGAASSLTDNLFRVSAKVQSQCSKKLAHQLAKTKEDFAASTGGTESEAPHHHTQQLDVEDQAAIERFRQEAHAEAVSNAFEMERCLGHVVHYGQAFQLVHVKSGKMLTIRSKEVADVESWCQRVSLSEHGGPDAWWTMEPRYRAMSVGEAVRYGDSISICSAKALGFMLHVANMMTEDAALDSDPYAYHEVNAYNIDVRTTWKFKSYTPFAHGLTHSIQGGDVIQLLHVELNALLGYANTPHAADPGSVYLRAKDAEVAADTLWRIEHQDSSDGRGMFFGAPCRLRHLLTDQYIALRPQGVAMVSTMENVPQSVLEMMGTGAHRDGVIRGEQLVYVFGCKSDVFLHSKAAMRATDTPLAEVSRTMQAQDALRIIKIPDDISGECARVGSARWALHRFHRVQQRADESSQSWAPGPLETRFSFRYATRVVDDVTRFTSGQEDGDLLGVGGSSKQKRTLELRRRRQSIVRQMSLLDDMVDTTVLMHKKMKPLLAGEQSIVISTPQQASATPHSPSVHTSARGGSMSARASRTPGRESVQVDLNAALKMYTASHKALQAAMRDNEDNIEFLGQLVPVLLQQMTAGQLLIVDARNTLHVMLSCDSHLKETIPLSVFEFFLSGVDTDPDAREEYIQCLAKLLCNRGVGIKRNQDIVLHRWLLDKRRSQLIYDTVSPEKGIVQVRVRPEPIGSEGHQAGSANSANAGTRHHVMTGSGSLHGTGAHSRHASVRIIDLEALTASAAEVQIYKMYKAQLDMLQKLCMGCNSEARTLIAGEHRIMPYSALLQCVINERLPSDLRCLYTRLMLSLYIEGRGIDRVMATRTVFAVDDVGKTSGLIWHNVGGTRPKDGEEITNARLSAALQHSAGRRLDGAKVLTQEDWDTLGITGLHTDCYVESGSTFFKPVALDLLPGHHAGALGDEAEEHCSHRHLRKEALLCLNNKATFNVPEFEKDEAKLTLALMELVQELTVRGFYSEPRVLQAELIPCLLGVLDHTSDVVVLPVDPRQGKTERVFDRHILCSQTQAMMQAKLVACKVTHQVCDMRLTQRLERMLGVAKELMFSKATGHCRRANSLLFAAVSFSATRDNLFSTTETKSAQRRAEMRAGKGTGRNSLSNVQVVMDLAADIKDEGMLDRIRGIIDYLPLVAGLDHSRFIKVLLDCVRCQMQELAQSALSLLIRDRTPVMELYLQLFDTQLLRQRQAEADYRKIGAMLNELREFVDPFQVTLSSTRAPHRLTAQQRQDLLLLLSDLTDMCSPDLRGPVGSQTQAGRSWMSKECMRRLNAHDIVLDMLCWCMTPFGDPNGVFVCAELHARSTSKTDPDAEQTFANAHRMEADAMRWLMYECLPAMFRFLEHYCRGLMRNQIAVSRHVTLMSAFLRWGVPGVPQALSGIFESNKALCEQMDKRVIDAVVDYLAYGPTGAGAAKPLRSRALADSPERPLSRADAARERFQGGSAPVTGGGGGGGGWSEKKAAAGKPVHDVLCLRFLETTFNVDGEMVRENQRYILHSLAMHGPASISVTPEERTRSSLYKGADSAMVTAEGEVKERALQLFRGKDGERVRAAARKARAGVEDPLQDVLEYNIALLRLLRFLSLDVSAADMRLLRSLFDPAAMAADVCGTASLGRAKAQILDLFCTLYLKPGLRKKSAGVAALTALWQLLGYLDRQLTLADERALAASYERSHGGDTLAVPAALGLKGEQAQKRANAELELLLADHWAPLLDVILDDTSMLQVLSADNRATLGRIFRRLQQLVDSAAARSPLDSVSLDHDSARHDEDRKVLETFVTIRALLKKLSTMQSAPISLPDAPIALDLGAMQFELHQRQLRRKAKEPKYTFARPREPKDSLIASRQLQCFAQALLQAVDPVIDEDEYDLTQPLQGDGGAGADAGEQGAEVGEEDDAHGEEGEEEDEDDEDDGYEEFESPEVRGELVGLCKIFYDEVSALESIETAHGHTNLVSQIEAVVDVVRTLPCNDLGEWECQMMVLLRLLRGLVVHWQGSVTDSLPPHWLLVSIPKLVVELLSIRRTQDRISMMALELGIVCLQVSPPAPMQESFYQVLVSADATSSDFMGELLVRMRRGEDEALSAGGFWDLMQRSTSSSTSRVSEQTLKSVQEYEAHLRGRARCLHLQMVQARRGEIRPCSHVESIFRFLQLLCEGHNLRLQTYLRVQKNSVRSVDLVSATASYVIAAAPHLCPLIMSEPLRAMQALAEYVQNPCRGNQRVLVDTALVATSNTLLNLRSGDKATAVSPELSKAPVLRRLGTGGAAIDADTQAAELGIQVVERHLARQCDKSVRGLHQLKAATITVLLSLLECVDEPYIPGRMLETLGDEPLRTNMNALLVEYNPELVADLRARGEIPQQAGTRAPDAARELSEEARRGAQEVAQQFYITYITLTSFDTTGRFQEGLTREKIWDIDSLRRTVGAIEISRSGVVEKAYFIVPTLCQYLTEASKQRILLEVNRANLQTMLTDFSASFDALYDEMRHQQKLTTSKVLNFFRVTLAWREKVFFYNAILINLLLLLFYNYECNKTFICGDNENLDYFRIKPGWSELVVVLACVQCLFAITRQWWYVIERGIPMINARIVQHSKRPPANTLWALLVWLPPQLADPIYRHIPKQHASHSNLGWGHSPWRLHFVKVLYMCTDLTFWMITMQTLVNILALLIKHEAAKLLLVVHLLEIFAHSRVLQNVMRSITYRGNTLLQTAGLALVFIYFFGVVGFMLFPELFQFAEADVMGGRKLEPNNNGARCTSIWKCSLVVLDMGLRKGDLGEAMDDIGWDGGDSGNPYRIFYRMIYTLLFFIIVSTILMNIIFGVIIDTFAELRARKDEIDKDISGRCFICGIDRFEFDQLGDGGNGFQEHITNDHNMWKYLYFSVYLRLKDFDNYSGGESYVFSKTLERVTDPHTHMPLLDVDTGLELKRPMMQIDLMWYPQKMAMRLKNQKATMNQQLIDRMKTLEDNVLSCATSLTEEMHKVSEAAHLRHAHTQASLRPHESSRGALGVHV